MAYISKHTTIAIGMDTLRRLQKFKRKSGAKSLNMAVAILLTSEG